MNKAARAVLPARADRSERLAVCLERARAGDNAALQEIARELTPLLWHVARAEGLPAGQVADVVQVVWLELLRRMREIRSPQALTAWLTTTTRREAWRAQRRTRRDAGSAELEVLADPTPDATDLLITKERDQVLIHHFRKLSRRCQELLRIVAQVDRPDYAVVAQALGMPRGSIGPTRGRCLGRLRDMLLADPRWEAK
jgi:RNA polymerase sigma factor (sigma-70 family)